MELKKESVKRWEAIVSKLREAVQKGDPAPKIGKKVTLNFISKLSGTQLHIVVPAGTEVYFFPPKNVSLQRGVKTAATREKKGRDLNYFMFKAGGFQVTYKKGAWLARAV